MLARVNGSRLRPAHQLSPWTAVFHAVVLGAALVVGGSAAALAQPTTAPGGPVGETTPERPGLFRAGSFYLTPYLHIGTMGIDTNVYYTATARQTDFSASGGPGLEIVRPIGKTSKLRLDGGLDYLYFARTESQRSLNGYGTVQLDLEGVKTRFFVDEHYASTYRRPSYEVNERVQQETEGTRVFLRRNLGDRHALALFGSRERVETDDQLYLGTNVGNTLTQDTYEAGGELRRALSVKTQLVGGGEQEWYRFPREPERDGDSTLAYGGFRTDETALIAGQALAGYRWFRLDTGGERSGFYARVDAAWKISPKTKLGARYDHDFGYSAFGTTGATPTNLNETAEIYLDKLLANNLYVRLFGRVGTLNSDGEITVVTIDGIQTAVQDDRVREAGDRVRLPVPHAGEDRGHRLLHDAGGDDHDVRDRRTAGGAHGAVQPAAAGAAVGGVIDLLRGRRHNGAVLGRAKGLSRLVIAFALPRNRPCRSLVRFRGLLVALALLAALIPTIATTADYEIGPGDVLKVVVLGQAEMTGTFTVGTDGLVTFPILGKIKASENTTLELERKLTILLADGILKRPQVTVIVGEYGSQKVFVTGEVQRPGQYPLKSDRTLLALLGDVGGLGPNAGHEVIVVRPPAASPGASGPAVPLSLTDTPGPGSGATDPPSAPATPATDAPPPSGIPGLPFLAPGSEVFHISLLELQSGNPGKNIALRAGDTVYFPKAAQVYVMGSVSRPGSYRFQEGMTVMQALTLAGGATERGSEGRTKLVRIVDGKKVERKAKPTEVVLPEDTLVVPERFF